MSAIATFLIRKKTAVKCRGQTGFCRTLSPEVLTTGIFGAWCTFEREEKMPQRSAEHGTLRRLRKEIFYDKNTFRLPRQLIPRSL